MRCPQLPERPATIEQLCTPVVEPDLAGKPAGDQDREPDTVDPRDVLADLAGSVDDMQSVYARFRDVDLPELVAAMDQGAVPPARAVTGLGELHEGMTGLLASIAAATGGPEPNTLDAAARQVQELAEALESESVLDRIRVLTTLVAPEYAADEAAIVREVAASAGEDTDTAIIAALDALVDIVYLGPSDLAVFHGTWPDRLPSPAAGNRAGRARHQRTRAPGRDGRPRLLFPAVKEPAVGPRRPGP